MPKRRSYEDFLRTQVRKLKKSGATREQVVQLRDSHLATQKQQGTSLVELSAMGADWELVISEFYPEGS